MARKRVNVKKPNKVLKSGPKFKSDGYSEIRSDSRSVARKSATNDPTWYETTPQLLKDAANITFSNASGVPYSLNGERFMEPGIMRMDIIPAIGDSGDPNSPLNLAAYNFYSFVRHANSGSVNYDSPDLMLYAVAIAQIYSYINWCMRVYGVVNLYSHANRYLPKAMVTAMGWDFDDIIASLPNFRFGLNVLIHKAASLACPADMTYFRRLAFLFSGIYAEGESVKSQLYFYNPVGFMQYDDAYNDAGGGMSVAYLPAKMTVSQMIAYGNSLLDPIISSEAMNIMSGDILKAYGDNILKLMPLEDNYIVLPITDLNVLEQMSNADYYSMASFGSKPTVNISQIIGTTNQRPHLHAEIRVSENTRLHEVTASHIINTILTSPTAGDVIERTRGMITMRKLWNKPSGPVTDDSYNNYAVYTGSDFVVGCYVFSFNPGDRSLSSTEIRYATTPLFAPAAAVQNWTGDNESLTKQNYQSMYTLLFDHCLLESFKFHPKVFYFDMNGDQVVTLRTAFAMD